MASRIDLATDVEQIRAAQDGRSCCCDDGWRESFEVLAERRLEVARWARGGCRKARKVPHWLGTWVRKLDSWERLRIIPTVHRGHRGKENER